MNKPDTPPRLIHFKLAVNPNGGDLWVNPAHIVAVIPDWFLVSSGQVISPDRANLLIEGNRSFIIVSSVADAVERIRHTG